MSCLSIAVTSLITLIEAYLNKTGIQAHVEQGRKVTYAKEVFGYCEGEDNVRETAYETDVLIEEEANGIYIPRVVIEAKYSKVTSHDAITYSTKAMTHRRVHPYLRYGIMLGGREHHAIPVRLVRHGEHFYFMAAFRGFAPTSEELEAFTVIHCLSQVPKALVAHLGHTSNLETWTASKFTSRGSVPNPSP